MRKRPTGPERRTFTAHLEQRSDDGMTFTGYAAVFNSDSEDMGFIERIAPGAFKKSLKSRNRIMLLANHNPEKPLASTRGGTLKLWEDEKGLPVEATLPDTSTGRDYSVLLREKIIDSMSIGFRTIKDHWEDDRRTLLEVELHEVSIVTFPAYEATTAAVRSYDQLADATGQDPAAVADVMTALSDGQTLTADQFGVMERLLDHVRPTDVVEAIAEESTGVPLDVLAARLDLLGKDI